MRRIPSLRWFVQSFAVRGCALTVLVATIALMQACRVTGSRLVVAEDHYPQGGIASAVLEALADASVPALKVAHLAVRGLPTSGTPAQLLDAAGISAAHIVDAAHRLLAA